MRVKKEEEEGGGDCILKREGWRGRKRGGRIGNSTSAKEDERAKEERQTSASEAKCERVTREFK